MVSNIKKVLLEKVVKGAKKKKTARVKLTWKRAPKSSLVLSAADKAALRNKRDEVRSRDADFVASTRDLLWERATAHAQKYGKHGPEYWFRYILHHTKLRVSKKKPSAWNAFVSLEVKRMNAGTYSIIFFSDALNFF